MNARTNQLVHVADPNHLGFRLGIVIVITKARFRPLLSPFISRFILIIVEPRLCLARAYLKMGRTRAQNGSPAH